MLSKWYSQVSRGEKEEIVEEVKREERSESLRARFSTEWSEVEKLGVGGDMQERGEGKTEERGKGGEKGKREGGGVKREKKERIDSYQSFFWRVRIKKHPR